MCSKEQVLNPISGKCVKKTSETGKLIQYYNWYINMDRGSNALYENSNDSPVKSYSFYPILKEMSKLELLIYLSDLGLQSVEGKSLKSRYPDLLAISIMDGEDPIEVLLEKHLSEQQEKGQLYEVLWDIFIKLGLSKFENNYYNIVGNVNLDRGEEYLKVSKIPDGTKTITYTDYFNKKCISGNTTGVSDISLKHKNSVSGDDRLEACEMKDIASKTIDNTIYISCKYYGDDNKKRISEYDLQNILSLIKNKYKKRIDAGEQIPNFDIYLFVKDKLKVQETINRSNKSSEYLRKNIKPEHVWDIGDLKQAFWQFYNFINNYRQNNGVIDNNIFRQITGEIEKPSLQLRFHQEYTIRKTLQNIGVVKGGILGKGVRYVKPKNSITQLWGMIPRSGKTYTAGGFIKEYSRVYTKEPCRVLVITSAPTETKGQWIDELFKKYQEFDGWKIEEINSKTIQKLRRERVDGHLVYVASKQYLDTGRRSKKSTSDGEEPEDVDLDQKKLEELIDLSTTINVNLIIFDENHLAGTTEKAKNTLELFGPTANKILLTATFNKSMDRFGIPSEYIITWDMKDIALCKQFDDPRKMSEFINNHPEDRDILIDILLTKYGINYDYYTQFNKDTNGILENYCLVKGKDFIENLYQIDNAKQLYSDLSIYPEVEGILQSKYDLNLSSLIQTSDNSVTTIEKCRILSNSLLETIEGNNNLISEQEAKVKTFMDSYKLFPDIHFIGLNFANDKLRELLDADTKYGFSMNALFMTNKEGTMFENTEAIDKLLDQIAGGISVPQHKSLFSSIRKVSSKYNSRTLQDGEFTSQLWFIPFGGKNTKINNVSNLLKRKLSQHPELGRYEVLSLYDDAAEDNNKRIKEYIKEKEIEAKSIGKNGLIILSGEKLKVGVSLKCVDIVFLLNDVQSNDTIYQSMFRALTESTNKKVGFVVNLNPFRMIEAIYDYSDRNVDKIEPPNTTIAKNIRNMLFYVDDYLFEFEDSIERSNKIMKIINDINRDNPKLQISIIEKKLNTTIDNIQFDLDNIVFLKQLYDEAKDIIDVDKKKKELLNDNLEDVVDKLRRGVETVEANNADARRTKQTREHQKQRVQNIGLIIIPFIKLFVVLTIDDETSLDLISMYKALTTPEMLPILLDKLDKWGIKNKQRFLMGFGRLIKTMYNSTEEQFITDAISIMGISIRENSQNNNSVSEEGSLEGGGKSKLSYILKNIHKISIGYNKFNRNLQKLGLCTNNKDICRLYSKYYLAKYNYLFNKF